MINKIYAIYDVKAGVYSNPFNLLNDSVAKRTFCDMAIDPNSQVSRNPGDYSLYCLGSYNDENGSIESSKKYMLDGNEAVSLVKNTLGEQSNVNETA